MEQENKPYAHREKAYMQGTLFPFIKVGMQKVNLTPTVTIQDGKKVMTPNAPVYIYDTSGPFSDPSIEIDLKKGIDRMRESWITGRGDVEYRTGRRGAIAFHYFGIRQNAPGRPFARPPAFRTYRPALSCQSRKMLYPNVLCQARHRDPRNGIRSYPREHELANR